MIRVSEPQKPTKIYYLSHPDGSSFTDAELDQYSTETGIPRNQLFGSKDEPHKLSNVENAEEISETPEFDLEKKKIEAYREFNDTRFLEATSREQLKEMMTDLIRETSERKKKAPSGNVPLRPIGYEAESDTQSLIDYEGSVRDLNFNSFDQMLTVLKARSDQKGDVEARRYLQELLNKQLDVERKEKGSEWEYTGSAKDIATKREKKGRWVKKK